jgi:hypothetical protein
MLQPRLEQHGAGDGAALAHPQAGQAQRGQAHRLHVADLLGQPVSPLEDLPGRPQVAVRLLSAGPVRERGPQLIRLAGDQFQAARRHRPFCLARHTPNVLGAAPRRRDRNITACPSSPIVPVCVRAPC